MPACRLRMERTAYNTVNEAVIREGDSDPRSTISAGAGACHVRLSAASSVHTLEFTHVHQITTHKTCSPYSRNAVSHGAVTYAANGSS